MKPILASIRSSPTGRATLPLAAELAFRSPYAPGDRGASRSWWLQQLERQYELRPPLVGSDAATVCIVGGGFTGLWTAIHLKRTDPTLDVALVEADRCGGGASGRNGGFVLTFWHHFLGLERLCGTDGALWLGQQSELAVEEIGRFCGEHARDAEFCARGWLWAASNQHQVGSWSSTMNALLRVGQSPFQELSREAAARRGASNVHGAGVFERTAASVQPARLVAALREAAARTGVRVYEHTAVRRLVADGTRSIVMTDQGSVRAERVVLAINAWSAGIPSVRRSIVVMGSDIVITASIAAQLDGLGLQRGLCISDSRLLVNYYRRTADDRLAFGQGGTYLAYGGRVGSGFSGESRRRGSIVSSLERTYPLLSGVRIDKSWTGPIDRTYDGLPFFVALGRPNVVLGAGFSGNGVGPCYIGGRILASLALELDDEWANCGLVRRPPRAYPPEPVCYLGGRLVRRSVERKERAEDRGAEARTLDRRLAGMAPTGLVPIHRGP